MREHVSPESESSMPGRSFSTPHQASSLPVAGPDGGPFLRRRSRRRTPVRAVAGFVALLFVAACGDSSDPTGPLTDPDIDVPGLTAEFGSSTRYLDQQATAAALIEADEENHRYTFDAAALGAAGGAPAVGEILLIHGVALRRVTSTSTSGGQITVETGYATLAEAFRNADIEWSHPTTFTPGALEHAELVFEGQSLAPTSAQSGTVQWEYEVPPYTVRGELEALGSTARVKIQAIKDLSTGNATAAFTGEGTIQAVRSNANIVIRDHSTRAFDYDNQGIGGNVKLSLAAAGAGNVGLHFKTPQAIIRFPFSIGPIPATLTIKAGMVTGIDVTGNSASVIAESNFSYGGDAGFRYDGTTLTSEASSDLAQAIATGGSADLAGAFGQSVSAQWGVVVPIIELGLFGEVVVPYIQPELYLRAFLTWGPVCQRIKVEYNVDGGIDLRFLGVQLGQAVAEQTIAGPWEMEVAQEGCDEQEAYAAEQSPPPIRW
jgi:hypothetical protein